MNYSKSITVDGTGTVIISFEAKDLDALIIVPTSDIYIGFGDITQAVMPVYAYSSFSITNKDFRDISRGRNLISVFAKSAGVSSNITISYLGENLGNRFF